MNYHYEIGEMNEIAGIVSHPGWEHIKKAFYKNYKMENDASRITGDAFQDGQLKGGLAKMQEVMEFLKQVEKNAIKQTEGDKKDV
jgi:hypothetical protein